MISLGLSRWTPPRAWKNKRGMVVIQLCREASLVYSPYFDRGWDVEYETHPWGTMHISWRKVAQDAARPGGYWQAVEVEEALEHLR